jgi:hypothetical protein
MDHARKCDYVSNSANQLQAELFLEANSHIINNSSPFRAPKSGVLFSEGHGEYITWFLILCTLNSKHICKMTCERYVTMEENSWITRQPAHYQGLWRFVIKIIFWVKVQWSGKNVTNIFEIQKRIIRIIMNANTRDSCRELFKELKILPLHSQYIISLSLFVKKIKTNINLIKWFTV